MYLVAGRESAALIDTGMGIGSLLTYVRGLTELPLIVVNTHGHPDHAGGNHEFEHCYMHSADRRWYIEMCTWEYRAKDADVLCPQHAEEYKAQLLPMAELPLPLDEMTRIELGGRSLRLIRTPGHTPGSVCLWDEDNQILFAGDSLSGNAVWMYDRYSEPLEVFYQSLYELDKEIGMPAACCIGHLPGQLPGDAIEGALNCAKAILTNQAQASPAETFAGKGLLYQCGASAILYNPECLFSPKRKEGS